MRVLLLSKENDFDPEKPMPPNELALTGDLELETIFEVMSAGDKYLLSVVRKVMLTSLTVTSEIEYRQEILRECIEHPAIIAEIYDLVVETLTGVNKVSFLGIGFFSKENPEITLHRAIQQLKYLSVMLRGLWGLGDRYQSRFQSVGFARFFEMLKDELDREYFEKIEEHLDRLGFGNGALISAGLGEGHKGADYTLRKSLDSKSGWIKRVTAPLIRHPVNTIVIPDRDEAGFKSLEELRGRGINSAANAVARSSDHVLSFFNNLRLELGFYLGCVSLHARLVQKGEPLCFPTPLGMGETAFSVTGLYDPSLSLRISQCCVGNDVDAQSKSLVMITGANQGGKSTFLRSAGIAQLMMQAGMFVTAAAFSANVSDGIFTHFKREEDSKMQSGKFEEELVRMSEIVSQITPNSILLLNESFSTTNEREGSEIARQIVHAMAEANIKIFFVTHQFDLANSFLYRSDSEVLFLRAERNEDGTRPFRIHEGAPLTTVHGSDLYERIFGAKP